MNRAHTALPAYLTQLAGGSATAAAPLQPRRPPFDPAGRDASAEPQWASSDFARAPIPSARTTGQPDLPPIGAAADVGGKDSHARRGAPPRVPMVASTAVHAPAPAAVAAPVPAPVPAARLIAPRARIVHHEPATAAEAFAAAPETSPASQPPTAAPVVPRIVPAAVIPVAIHEHLRPATDLVPRVHPPAPPAPGPAPASPRPAPVTEQSLLPRVVDDAVTAQPPLPRRTAAMTPTAPARVTIGTIDVTVVAPTSNAAPAPHSHPLAAAPGGAEVALRGASRRWFGAGQS